MDQVVVVRHKGNVDEFINDMKLFISKFKRDGYFKEVEAFKGANIKADNIIIFYDRKEVLIDLFDDIYRLKSNIQFYDIKNFLFGQDKMLIDKQTLYLVCLSQSKLLDVEMFKSKLEDKDNYFGKQILLYYKKGIEPLTDVSYYEDDQTAKINQLTLIMRQSHKTEDKIYYLWRFLTEYGQDSLDLIKDELTPDLWEYYKLISSGKIKVSRSTLREVRVLPLIKRYLLRNEIRDYLSKKMEENFYTNKELKSFIDEAYKVFEIDLIAKASDISLWFHTYKTSKNKVNGNFVG